MRQLLREMIREVLLEASRDKMRNMGIPNDIINFIDRMLPDDCKEQGFWFAQQYSKTMHQWDDLIGAYKAARKARKKMAKKLKKQYPEQWQTLFKANYSGDALLQVLHDVDDHGTLDIADRLFTGYEPTSQSAIDYRAEQSREQSAINQLKGVLRPVADRAKFICRWASEAGVNLSKRKTAEVTETDEEGNEVTTKVPFTLAVAERLANDHFGTLEGTVFMKFEDGWYWLDREVNYCGIEAERMGHCGRAMHNSSTLWSLRDTQGMPHVTAEIRTTGDGRIVYQMKGKQNTKPDEKYNSYIYQLLLHPEFNLHNYAAVGNYGDDLKEEDIPEDVWDQIMEVNKDTYEEKTDEERAEEAAQQAYDDLYDELTAIDARVELLGNISAEWEIHQDETGDEEYPISTDAHWTATIRLDHEDFGDQLLGLERRTNGRVNTNGLLEHFDQMGYSFPGEPRINQPGGHYSYLVIDFYDTDPDYGSSGYESWLEWLNSEFGSKWDDFVDVADSYLVAAGNLEPKEGKDYYVVGDALQANLEHWDMELMGGDVHFKLEFSFPVDTRAPTIPPEAGDKLSEELTKLYPPHAQIEDVIRISATRGKNTYAATLKLTMDWSVDADNEIAYLKWVDDHVDDIRNLARSIGEEYIHDPYDLDVKPEDSSHALEAMKHHGIDTKSLYGYRTRNVSFYFEAWEFGPLWKLLDLIHGPEKAEKMPGYAESKGSNEDNFVWDAGVPANSRTIREWIPIVQQAVEDIRALHTKAGVDPDDTYPKYDVSRLWQERVGSQQESAIRALVRGAVRLSERSSRSRSPRGRSPGRR